VVLILSGFPAREARQETFRSFVPESLMKPCVLFISAREARLKSAFWFGTGEVGGQLFYCRITGQPNNWTVLRGT